MIQLERAGCQCNNPEDRILQTDPPGGPIITSGRTNVKQINEPQDQIIGTSNKLTNPQYQITETL